MQLNCPSSALTAQSLSVQDLHLLPQAGEGNSHNVLMLGRSGFLNDE
ncbi:hypothetical protein SAMN05444161_1671 [Rhizobiales bacterium GAS191]|nr:hypothetical protein SAMN05444161_1671 [Rhizobiales bacterium GAS191]